MDLIVKEYPQLLTNDYGANMKNYRCRVDIERGGERYKEIVCLKTAKMLKNEIDSKKQELLAYIYSLKEARKSSGIADAAKKNLFESK